jgi:hypothetical protein
MRFFGKQKADVGAGLKDVRQSEKDDESGAAPMRQVRRIPSGDKGNIFDTRTKPMSSTTTYPKKSFRRQASSGVVTTGPKNSFLRQASSGLVDQNVKRSSVINEAPTKLQSDVQKEETSGFSKSGSSAPLQMPTQSSSTRLQNNEPIVVRFGLENLPWDKIAVGIVLDDDNSAAGTSISMMHRPQSYRTSAPIVPASQPATLLTRPLTAQRPPQSRPNPASSLMIDVGTGVKMPFRGSDETWKAIEYGRVTLTTCISCQIELNCLEDAQLVICPDCSMMSPVDQTPGQGNVSYERYGVGVGVKLQDILEWVERNMSSR